MTDIEWGGPVVIPRQFYQDLGLDQEIGFYTLLYKGERVGELYFRRWRDGTERWLNFVGLSMSGRMGDIHELPVHATTLAEVKSVVVAQLALRGYFGWADRYVVPAGPKADKEVA